MWLTGLVAPRHVGSSQTRARTRVPCISRQILDHCATREALSWETFNTRLSAEPDQHWEDFGGRCPGLVLSAFLPHLPSLPTHQGIRARDQLHRHLEEAIAEKLHEDKAAAEPGDALDGIIHSTRELGHELSVQELKVGGGRFLLLSFAFLAGLYTHAASLEQRSYMPFGPTLSHRHSSG